MAYFSRFSRTVPEVSDQRGVGCTHVVKPPLVILYFSRPTFSSVLP